MLRLFKENDSVLSFNLSIVIYDKTGFINRGYTKIKGEMNHKLVTQVGYSPSKISDDGSSSWKQT